MAANVPKMIGVFAVVACLAGGAEARPVDQPIDGQRLLLRVDGKGRERLVFLSRDRAVALAAPAESEPSTLELFSHTTGEHAVLPFGPPEEGGWSKRRGGRRGPVVKFRSPGRKKGGEGVDLVVHRVGRRLVVVGSAIGLAPDVAHGGVGVRLTIGAARVCALFDAPTVRRAAPGFFSARKASADTLADCSDASLFGTQPTTTVPTTTTTSSTSSTTTTVPSGLLIGNPVEFPTPSDHSPGFLVGTQVDVPIDSTVTHFGVIGKVGGPRVRLGLYTDLDGEPSTLVVGTAESELPAGRLEIAVPATPVAAGAYWLMAMYDSPASVGLDESDPAVLVKFTDASFVDGLPSFVFFSETFFGQQYNYYVRIMP